MESFCRQMFNFSGFQMCKKFKMKEEGHRLVKKGINEDN